MRSAAGCLPGINSWWSPAVVQVTIVEAGEKLYAATIDGKIAMKIGPVAWDPTRARINVGQKVWLLAVGGLGFAVWEAMF